MSASNLGVINTTVERKPRICAVSYLNTVPLVWGFSHGLQKEVGELCFATPSECARRVAAGEADIGIVPVIEIQRNGWKALRRTGIASNGAVRSILLVSKMPPGSIRTLATDTGSRTSVMLARILLTHLHGADPQLIPMAPALDRMLECADAALLIGDAALGVDPAAVRHLVLDLGEEWTKWTGLPMVFALWAGPASRLPAGCEDVLVASCRAGIINIEEIVRREAPGRGLDEALVRRYLTTNIQLELNESHWQGMERYLDLALALEPARPKEALSLC